MNVGNYIQVEERFTCDLLLLNDKTKLKIFCHYKNFVVVELPLLPQK